MSKGRVKPTRVAPIERPASELAAAEPVQEPVPGPAAVTFRPTLRPPMAELVVLDDGSSTGEAIRLRQDRTIIGRLSGDIVIPHDALISSEHLEILRCQETDGFRWYLRDLGSTNGTFVRLKACRLRHNFELFLGRYRYRFRLPGEKQQDDSEAGTEQGTRGWAAVSRDALAGMTGPQLVQFDGDDESASLPLQSEQMLGQAPGASGLTVDDPLLDAVHARIVRKSSGKWYIEDQGSVNGIWVRVERSRTAQKCEFQLGEQRFVLRIL